MIITRDLSPHVRAVWNSTNGTMTLEHRSSNTKIILTPQEQIEMISLLEDIVERDLKT